MNKITRKIIALSLALCLVAMLGVAGVALAKSSIDDGSGSGGQAVLPPAGSEPSTGATQDEARTRSIQENFNVNKYLTAEGQASKVGGGIVGFATEIIGRFVQVIGSISLVIFIIGAIMTITSEGKEDRLEKGKTAMIYSLIGLVIALFSFIIVAFVQSVLF